MGLFETVNDEIKKAMLARDKVRLEALRGIKKEFLEAKTAKGAHDELSPETAAAILQKMVKQRKDSAEIYASQNRNDLAELEIAQMKVIQEFLPKQLSGEELETALKEIISETGASSPKDMGKVMGLASKRLAGKAEGRAISETVKKLLAE
ncbi:MAG TPA: glutamyl-tRNA amidotransferase [Porphyromonadaceae bacterium]|nr:glutamyl-tRNA amidotransferase [Porphyromonadaceae bacterium]